MARTPTPPHLRSTVPSSRIRVLVEGQSSPEARYVLYWMIASRRLGWNFALERAVELANAAGKPLLVFEPLRAGYRHASPRFHAFVLQGMAEHATQLATRGIAYYPYVEPEVDAAKGLMAALAQQAVAVATDDHPGFHYPAMLNAAARQLEVRLEAVDSNGLVPLRDTPRKFERAHDLRRHLQRVLPEHLAVRPLPDPLALAEAWPRLPLPSAVLARWPPATDALLATHPEALARLPLDAGVPTVDACGGAAEGHSRLQRFLRSRLSRYVEERSHPDLDASSGLSPYLHFGHVGSHQVFEAIAQQENWSANALEQAARGAREGWWGMSPDAEAFLDQLVTWRELGFRACLQEPAPDTYGSLPPWARATLEAHAADERAHRYTRKTLERARTHDPLWNAAQTQLLREGVIHNQLRMLWGKNVLSWTQDPEAAFATLVHLNDRFALDGRDPNSYAGIGWVLGRYDRPWGPERPIFGKVRYMTSGSANRRLALEDYLNRYGG